jgi:hypothetical protein
MKLRHFFQTEGGAAQEVQISGESKREVPPPLLGAMWVHNLAVLVQFLKNLGTYTLTPKDWENFRACFAAEADMESTKLGLRQDRRSLARALNTIGGLDTSGWAIAADPQDNALRLEVVVIRNNQLESQQLYPIPWFQRTWPV